MQPPDSPSPSSPPPEPPQPPPPERAKSTWFDYLLIASTGVLFLLYLPLFRAAPRLASLHLRDAHLLWLLPLLMMCVCLAAFCVWVWRGPTDAVRIIWALVLPLAVLGYPPAVLAAGFTMGSRTRNHSTQLPPHSPPVPIERRR